MARLGKPKGSKNKKTLERLAAAAQKNAAQEKKPEAQEVYPTTKSPAQLFSEAGPFYHLPGPEPQDVQGRFDPNLFNVSANTSWRMGMGESNPNRGLKLCYSNGIS
jgi:hypothetical protein